MFMPKEKIKTVGEKHTFMKLFLLSNIRDFIYGLIDNKYVLVNDLN